MAYGLLLYKELTTPLGKQRLEIYKDGFSGTAVEIAGLHKDGITIGKDSSDITQAITTSVLTIRLSDCGEVDYTQFFTPNATLFKVVWLTKITGANAWETRWTGFITPDSYTENLAWRDTLTLTARDNLGRLADYDFDLANGQMITVRSLLTQAMTKAGVAMTLSIDSTKVASSPTTTLAVDGIINTSLLQGMTWHDAVSLVLEGLGLTLAWNDGNAFSVRDITQAPATSQAAFFVGKSGFRQIRPAWKNLTVGQDYGLRDNFYEGQFSKDDVGGVGPSYPTFTPPSGGLWTVTGTMTLLNPYNGAPSPYETIYPPIQAGDAIDNSMTYTYHVPAILRTIKMQLRCSNSAWRSNTLRNAIWAQAKIQTGTSQGQPVKRNYWLRYRFNIFFTTGGVRYILRDEWEVYNAATIAQPYLYFVMPGSAENTDQDNDVEINIAELPGTGDIEFVVYPIVAQLSEEGNIIDYATGNDYGRITDITFAVREGIGARNKLIEINADHNVRATISLSLGRVPEGRGNNIGYFGGLFASDGEYTPLQEFARAASGTEYDLLELVAREHITYNASNLDALSGTMMAEGAFRFDKAIAFDEKTYRIVGASLAILSNTLSVQVIHEEAAFISTALTISDVDVEGSGRAAGGGGSVAPGSGGGGDSRFFTAIAGSGSGSGETIGAKAIYDLYITQTPEQPGSGSGDGTPEVTKNITDILRHLSLQTENNELMLVCDIALVTEEEAVAGGIASGGGGGGTGSLAGLTDVTLSSLAGGQTLVFNSTSTHWENVDYTLANLTDVTVSSPASGQVLAYNGSGWANTALLLSGLSDVSNVGATDGQALIWDGTNNIWKPGNVAGGVTVVSADADIGTTLTTIATVNGTAIKAKVSTAHSHSNKSVLDGISSTDVTNWGTAFSNVGKASVDPTGNALATQDWVTGKNYLTAAVTKLNDLTGAVTLAQGTGVTISKSGSTLTISATTSYTLPAATSGALGGICIGFTTSGQDRNYAVALGTGNKAYVNVPWENTVYTHPTGGANTTITAANGKVLSAITVDSYGHTTSVSSKTLAAADIPDLSGSYLPISGGTLTGNLTIGASNSAKSLTIYGSTASSAILIYGGGYSTGIYRRTGDLYITSGAYVNGSLEVNGNEYVTGEAAAGTASDRRLKSDITTMAFRTAARTLSALRPVTFRWNKDAERLSEGHKSGFSRGFIADEYNATIANATRKIWGDYDAIDYEATIPYLVAGWQLHEAEMTLLRGELRALRKENESLRRRLREYGK